MILGMTMILLGYYLIYSMWKIDAIRNSGEVFSTLSILAALSTTIILVILGILIACYELNWMLANMPFN